MLYSEVERRLAIARGETPEEGKRLKSSNQNSKSYQMAPAPIKEVKETEEGLTDADIRVIIVAAIMFSIVFIFIYTHIQARKIFEIENPWRDAVTIVEPAALAGGPNGTRHFALGKDGAKPTLSIGGINDENAYDLVSQPGLVNSKLGYRVIPFVDESGFVVVTATNTTPVDEKVTLAKFQLSPVSEVIEECVVTGQIADPVITCL